MILFIKNHMLFYDVCGCDGKAIYKIKNKRIWTADKEILDLENQPVYTVGRTVVPGTAGRENVQYLICRPGKEDAVATASLIYEDLKQTIYQLPKVRELAIDSINGRFNLSRSKGDIFQIKARESIIGEINAHPMFHAAVLSCNAIEDQGFLSALFVFTRYMRHEDELIVV